jgi:predicted small lipoprotein YifL
MKTRVMFLLRWMLAVALVSLAGCGTVDKNDPTYNTKQILIRDTRPSN